MYRPSTPRPCTVGKARKEVSCVISGSERRGRRPFAQAVTLFGLRPRGHDDEIGGEAEQQAEQQAPVHESAAAEILCDTE